MSIVKKYAKTSLMLAMMGAAMMSGMPIGGRDIVIHNGSTKSYNPWDKIQLTKSERKGKSYEEIQAIKKERWERSRHA